MLPDPPPVLASDAPPGHPKSADQPDRAVPSSQLPAAPSSQLPAAPSAQLPAVTDQLLSPDQKHLQSGGQKQSSSIQKLPSDEDQLSVNRDTPSLAVQPQNLSSDLPQQLSAADLPQLSKADTKQLPSADPASREHGALCEEPEICATKVIHCGWLDNTLPPPRQAPDQQAAADSMSRYKI